MFETEEVDQALSSIGDPYIRLCAAVIFRAILDCHLEPEAPCNCSKAQYHYEHQKEDASDKRSAIDFIMSNNLEFWIDISGLNIDPGAVRDALKNEIPKRDYMTEIINKNIQFNKPKKERGKLRLKEAA